MQNVERKSTSVAKDPHTQDVCDGGGTTKERVLRGTCDSGSWLRLWKNVKSVTASSGINSGVCRSSRELGCLGVYMR